MPFPVSRITDMHVCPMVTVLVPHVGGPIVMPGMPTVLVGKLPIATMGSMAVCVGPPDSVMMGNPTVLAGKKPIARMTSTTAHGGMVILGQPTVLG